MNMLFYELNVLLFIVYVKKQNFLSYLELTKYLIEGLKQMQRMKLKGLRVSRSCFE